MIPFHGNGQPRLPDLEAWLRSTNDISLVLLYVVCAALLVLVVAGWRVLSRPGVPDSRLPMLLKTHRWEALLLLGLPLGSGALDTALRVVALDLGNALTWEHKHYAWRVLVLAALVVAYPRVRRQGSELLVLLWQLLMVVKAIGFAMNGVEALLGYDGVIVSHEVDYEAWFLDQAVTFNIITVTGVLRVLGVVWFMRLASRTSLGRAFLLFGLSMADPHITPHDLAVFIALDPLGSPLPYLLIIGGGLADLLTQVGLNVLMFWMLTRHEALDPKAMRSAAVMLVVAGSLFPQVAYMFVIGSFELSNWLDVGHTSEVISGNLTAYAIHSARQVAEVLLVALLAYLVRVRRPAGPSEAYAAEPPVEGAGPGAPSP